MSDNKEKTPATQQPVKAVEQAATTKPEEAPQKRVAFSGNEVTILLECPITLGADEQVIDQITMTKPRMGSMRNLSMFEVMHLDTDTVAKLLPRITRPPIHKPIADQLDPADLATIGKCIGAFFGGKKAQEDLEEQIEEMNRKK